MKSNIENAEFREPHSIRSNWIDRSLLFGFIVLIPLQGYFPTIGGATVAFLFMAMMIIYLLVRRPIALAKTLRHPICLAGFLFAGVSFLMELLHGSHSYKTVLSTALMIVGAAVVAALCRDRRAFRYALYGFMMASFIVGLVLIMTAYGKLDAVEVQSFDEASFARANVYRKAPLGADINTLAFHAGQGVIAALVLGLTTRSFFQRFLAIGIGLFLAIGSFMPMSRGALVSLMVSCSAVVYLYGLFRPRVILAMGILFFGVLMLVPSTVLTRFDLTNTGNKERETESRGKAYVASVVHFPEYALVGIGETDFWSKWGRSSGFYNFETRGVTGPHNIFLQVLLFWGLPGILSLLLIIWKAYKYYPKIPKSEPLRLLLMGICVSVILECLVVQVMSGKEFSIALGLIIGSSIWIWPQKGLSVKPIVKKGREHVMTGVPRGA